MRLVKDEYDYFHVMHGKAVIYRLYVDPRRGSHTYSTGYVYKWTVPYTSAVTWRNPQTGGSVRISCWWTQNRLHYLGIKDVDELVQHMHEQGWEQEHIDGTSKREMIATGRAT